MLTVSTGELTGALGDVIPFASTEVDDPACNCVRIEYDGANMFTLAGNRNQYVRCTFDDFKLLGDAQPFSVRIPLNDAKAIATAFKLPSKHGYAPVHVDTSTLKEVLADNEAPIRFWRAAAVDWSALTVCVIGRGAPGVEHETDIHQLIEDKAKLSAAVSVLALDPKRLASFGKVRPHGPLVLEPTGQEWQAVRFRMGNLFEGVMYPVRPDSQS